MRGKFDYCYTPLPLTSIEPTSSSSDHRLVALLVSDHDRAGILISK